MFSQIFLGPICGLSIISLDFQVWRLVICPQPSVKRVEGKDGPDQEEDAEPQIWDRWDAGGDCKSGDNCKVKWTLAGCASLKIYMVCLLWKPQPLLDMVWKLSPGFYAKQCVISFNLWPHPQISIPNICHFFSTYVIFGSIFLHTKVHKSRQNRFSDKSA